MELIYSWMGKFRNFEETEVNFSERFKVSYDHGKKRIKINLNHSYISLYPNYITNISAVVGRNGVGKTNLLDAIGLRTNDRNKNNAEFETKYKKKNALGYRIPDDIEAEIKHSFYFSLYYMGKDENEEDLFCIEGNDIESFQNIIRHSTEISINYWKSKYWFAFICNYSEEGLIYKCDLGTKAINYKVNKNNFENKREMDKLSIISLRENLNEKYYDSSSTKPEDDYKISVPRRTGTFQSKFVSKKIEMLFHQLQKTKRLMFTDKEYTLKITYNDYFLLYGLDNENKLNMPYSYKNLNEQEEVCKVLESFIQYFFNSISNNLTNEKIEKIEKEIAAINIRRISVGKLKNYYHKVVEIISSNFFEENDYEQHVLTCYESLANELSQNRSIKFDKNHLILKLKKSTNISEVLSVINLTIDEKTHSIISDKEFSVFSGFFNYSIEDLSDGEAAYLGFFASLNEQISLLTPNKENYIILLDEPEARMHPELTRNFINELILFLGDLSEEKKKFQIITSTHSPFILSDIPSTNIIYFEKDNEGYCKVARRNVNTFGVNIHTLFKDGFFMYSTMGEYATSQIKEVVSLITNNSAEGLSDKQKDRFLYIINSIGEPLIRNRIMKMFNDKFDLDYTNLYNENLKMERKLKYYEEPKRIDGTIELLRKQIGNLQEQVYELEEKINDKDKY